MRRTAAFVAAGLVVTLMVVLAASLVGSDEPDGLEFVAQQEGFASEAEEHDLAQSPLADYGENVGTGWVATAAAGVAGVLVTLGLGYGVFWLARRRQSVSGA